MNLKSVLFPRLLVSILTFFMLLSCSQNSSEIPTERQQPSDQAVDGVEEVTGIPDLQKPVGQLGEHLKVDAGRLQISDANLLVSLEGSIENISGVPITTARWALIEGPLETTILSPNQLRTQVLTPDVREPTRLVFRLYAVNSENYTNADSTSVIVQPLIKPIRVVSAAVDREGSDQLSLRVVLAEPAEETVTVDYYTVDRTAIDGVDYVAVRDQVEFAAGETEKVLTVTLLNSPAPAEQKYFQVNVSALIPVEGVWSRVNVSGIGVITDEQQGPAFPTTPPLDEGPSDAGQHQVPGTPGDVRVNLSWDEPLDRLNLQIEDPCGNLLTLAGAPVECLGWPGLMDAASEGGSWQNAFWPEYAPPGRYRVSLEHFSGLPADYNLRIFYGEESRRFSGTIASGDTVEVFSFDYLGSSNLSSSSSSVASSEVSVSSSSSLVSSSSGAASSSEPSSSSESSASSIASSSGESNSSIESSSSSAASAISEPNSSSLASSSSELSSSSESSLSSSSVSSAAPLNLVLDTLTSELLFAPKLSLTGTVTFDPNIPVERLRVEIARQSAPARPLAGLDFASDREAWQPERGVFVLDVDLAAWTLSDDFYLVTVIAVDALQRTAISQAEPFELYSPAPMRLTLVAPGGTQYSPPVLLSGSVEVDPRLQLTFQSTLELLNSGQEAQPLALTWDGPIFTGLVTEPGEYRFSVFASAGLESQTQEVEFSLVIPEFSIAVDPINPLVEGAVDLIEPLQLLVTLEGHEAIPLYGLALEALVEGQWVALEDYDLEEVWRSEEDSAFIVFDFDAYAWSFGEYQVRIRVDHAGEQPSYSDVLDVIYRAAQPPQLSISAPVLGETYWSAVGVRGNVVWDAALSSGDLSAQLIGPEGQTVEVPLSANGSEFSGQIGLTNLLPGTHELQIQALDRLGLASSYSVEFDYQRPTDLALLVLEPSFEGDSAIVRHPLMFLLGQVQFDPDLSLTELTALWLQDGEPRLEFDLLDAAWNPDLGEFQAQVPWLELGLIEGEYELQVQATDGLGRRVSSELLPVNLQVPNPPSITLIAPVEQTYFGVVPVVGEVLWDPVLSIQVFAQLVLPDQNEVSVSTDLHSDSGSFSADLPAVTQLPGSYQLAVWAEDSAGQTTERTTVSFIVANPAPLAAQWLTPELPEDGWHLVLASGFDVVGVVDFEPEVPLSAVSLNISSDQDGMEELLLEVDLLQLAQWSTEQQFLFSLDLEDLGLAAGFYHLQLKVSDQLQRVAESAVFPLHYRVPEQPILSHIEPQNDTHFIDIPISGSVTWDEALDIQVQAQWRLLEQDTPSASMPLPVTDGIFAGQIPVQGLVPGDYELQLIAEDSLGQRVVSDRVFRYQRPAELIVHLLAPNPEQLDYEVLTPFLSLSGQVSFENEFPLTELRVEFLVDDRLVADLNLLEDPGWQSSESTFETRIALEELNLAPGEYAVHIAAQDLLGRHAQSETALIHYRVPEQLRIELVSPEPDNTYFTAIPVRGRVIWDDSAPLRAFDVWLESQDEDGAFLHLDDLPLDGQSFAGTILPPAPGEYLVRVAATDQLGRIAESTAQVRYLHPGEVAILLDNRDWPEQGVDILQPTLNIMGSVHYQPELPLRRAEFRVPEANPPLVFSLLEEGVWDEPGTFSLPMDLDALDLGEGNHTVELYLQDSLGREAQVDFEVRYSKPRAPEVILTSPEPLTYYGPLVITGRLAWDEALGDDAISAVYAQLIWAGEEQEELFDAPLSLSFSGPEINHPWSDTLFPLDGDYRLVVWAEDRLGNPSAQVETAFAFQTPEDLIIHLHAPDVVDGLFETIGSEFHIWANVEYQAGYPLEVLEVHLDGVSVLSFINNWNPDTGEFGRLVNFGLGSGDYTMQILAQDTLGRRALTDAFILRVRQPMPMGFSQVSLLSEGDETDTYLVSGQYSADPLALPLQMWLEVENFLGDGFGQSFLGQGAEEGTFSVSFSADQLYWGENILRLAMRDNLGRNSTYTVPQVLEYPLLAPQAEFLEFAQGTGQEAGAWVLVFDIALDPREPFAAAASPLDMLIRINDLVWDAPIVKMDEAPHRYRFLVPSELLLEGQNLITVEAADSRDAAVRGNSNFSVNHFHQPEVSILSPEPDSERVWSGPVTLEVASSIAGGGEIVRWAVSVNGQAAEFDQSFPAQTTRLTLAAEYFEAGKNLVEIIAFSANGISSDVASLVVNHSDSAVQIDLQNPRSAQTLSGPVQVFGYVHNAGGREVLEVMLNDREIIGIYFLGPDNSFQFSIPANRLSAGEQLLTITAFDELQQIVAEFKQLFTYEPSAPLASGGDILVFNDINPLHLDSEAQWVSNWFDFESRSGEDLIWLDDSRNRYCPSTECESAREGIGAAAKNLGLDFETVDSRDGALLNLPERLKALVILMTTVPFSAEEVESLRRFSARGGRIIYIGENNGCSCSSPEHQNRFLEQMGVDLVQAPVNFGHGAVKVTDPSIHPILKGVEAITMSAAGTFTITGPNAVPLVIDEQGLIVTAIAKVNSNPYTPMQLGIVSPKSDGVYVASGSFSLSGFIETEFHGLDFFTQIIALINGGEEQGGAAESLLSCWFEAEGCTLGDEALKGLRLDSANRIEVRATNIWGYTATAVTEFEYVSAE